MRLLTSLIVLPLVASLTYSAEKIQLVSDREHRNRLALIPSSTDKRLDKIKADERLIFYDKDTTPPVFQHWEPATLNSGGVNAFGLVSTKINISANPSEPFGNANREFPWVATVGIREDQPVRHFVIMPAPARLEWVTQRRDMRYDETYLKWTYAPGTVFGEIICVIHPINGAFYATEIRLRTKGEKGWTATAYRPFPTKDDLLAVLDEPGVPAADRAILKAALASPTQKVTRMKNRHRNRGKDVVLFDATGTWEYLPEISPAATAVLLDRPFSNALGSEWRRTDPPTHAPTTSSAFHIVPRDYNAACVEVSTTSCNRCHETALRPAEDVETFRDWYGRVRGSDTIFSFHPFDPVVASRPNTTDRRAIFHKLFLDRNLFVFAQQ